MNEIPKRVIKFECIRLSNQITLQLNYGNPLWEF